MRKQPEVSLTLGRLSRTVFSWQLFLAVLLAVAWSGPALSATGTFPLFTGEIERLTLNNPADIYSGGKMVVGGQEVILPRNLLIDLPANRLTLQQIFAQAPAACIALGESGLAKADRCNNMGNGANAAIASNVTNAGNNIVGDILIQKGLEVLTGQVTYIDYTDGYYRLNGKLNDKATGVMVRLNDPTSRHTVQQGSGCLPVNPATGRVPDNCSADPRFTLDPDNYVNVFATGYPYCIPSTVGRTFDDVLGLGTTFAKAAVDGTGDVLCPMSNRAPGLISEPPAADSRRFAPVILGDNITAEGNFETVNGVRFLSAHTTKINKGLLTRNVPGQPDYLFLDEVFIDGPGFQNQRVRALIIGFTTLSPTDVDFWSIHRDPVNNAIHEFPLASVQGCDAAAGAGSCSNQGVGGLAGANIFSIRYDVDFRLAALGNPPGGARADASPCSHLINSRRFSVSNPGLCPGGPTFANNFGVLSPIPHEIQSRTGHLLDSPPNSLVTLDINGNEATNGQYLFPFGMNLGGIDIPNFFEIDLNLVNTPTIFEGIPWNLDRRLSPGGCLNAGGCEPGAPSSAFALDPFPFSGLDPRTQVGTPHTGFNDSNYTASPLSDASNRILSFVRGAAFAGKFKFDGNNTVLSTAIATDPPGTTIPEILPLTTAFLASALPFGPAAVDDTAATGRNGTVSIGVLNNDTAVFGAINPATVTVITAPAQGTATPVTSGALAGRVTYRANAFFSGTETFTYTVADIFGAVSNVATVSVTVNVAGTVPLAANDSATTPMGVATTINVIANDLAFGATLIPGSVSVSTTPTTTGSAVSNSNGTVTYTPPAGFTGVDGFTYTVGDSLGQTSNIATVFVNVATTAPVAIPDTATTLENTPATFSLTSNDTDADGNLASGTVAFVALPAHGVVASLGAGSVTYTPNLYYHGLDTFTYTVSDLLGAVSNAASVTITITEVNDRPLAVNDATGTLVNTPVTISVLANDTDVDGTINTASVIATTPTSNGGTAVANANGTVTYTPAPGFAGSDIFTYTVKDTLGAVSNPATVTVVVGGGVEMVTVALAQFRTVTPNVSGDWRVEGTATPNTTVNIHVGNDLTGATVGTVVADAGGRWRFQVAGSTVLPGPTNTISVSTTGGATRLAFPVSVR